MEVLFHFVFELFKIAVLASLYATIIVLIIGIVANNKPDSWFDRVAKKKIRLWFLCWFFTSVALFIFMFSYWGDHGLGDSARIPVGYGKAVDQLNGSVTYIRAKGYEEETLDIEEFAITEDFLFAKVSDSTRNEEHGEIAVWDLHTNDIRFLKHYPDIEHFKESHQVKATLTFMDFQGHYNKYWSGWRFWLLP